MSSILRSQIVGAGIVDYNGVDYLRSLGGPANVGNRADDRLNRNDRNSPKGCWVNVYLDGISIWDGPPSLPPELSRFSPQQLAGIEFYTGASTPTAYKNIKNSCGVLLLWTRER